MQTPQDSELLSLIKCWRRTQRIHTNNCSSFDCNFLRFKFIFFFLVGVCVIFASQTIDCCCMFYSTNISINTYENIQYIQREFHSCHPSSISATINCVQKMQEWSIHTFSSKWNPGIAYDILFRQSRFQIAISIYIIKDDNILFIVIVFTVLHEYLSIQVALWTD